MLFQLMNVLLTLHIVGIVMLAGITLADYITHRHFWKIYGLDKEQQSLAVMENLAKFSRFTAIGIALLILTGIGMMAITRGVYGEQLWFRIKMIVLLIAIGNALFVARPQAGKFFKILKEHFSDPGTPQKLATIRRRINLFHIIQLSLLLLIFTLSVFKFN